GSPAISGSSGEVCGSGRGSLSSNIHSICDCRAPCILCSTSSRVFPVAKHPGTSGENALKVSIPRELGPLSITTRYLIFFSLSAFYQFVLAPRLLRRSLGAFHR